MAKNKTQKYRRTFRQRGKSLFKDLSILFLSAKVFIEGKIYEHYNQIFQENAGFIQLSLLYTCAESYTKQLCQIFGNCIHSFFRCLSIYVYLNVWATFPNAPKFVTLSAVFLCISTFRFFLFIDFSYPTHPSLLYFSHIIFVSTSFSGALTTSQSWLDEYL